MPCSDGRDSEAYQEMHNKHEYGLERTDFQINRAVMCEMSKLLAKYKLTDKLSDLATKWIENHKEWDRRMGN